ncbi:MAG: CvpA family protein [Schleiferiaceae bacterium]|jgi:membrane protein required for colicin V production
MVKGLDLVLTVFAAFLLVKGIWKGFVKEISGILAVVGGVIASFLLHGAAEEFLGAYIGPKYLAFVSYAILFIAVYLGIMLLGNLIDRVVKSVMLGGFNRILGGFFGLLKALLWTSLCVYAYSTLQEGVGFEHPSLVSDSIFYPFLLDFVALLEHGL